MREWAKASGALIISVDYTLAPDAKYPYSLDECYYVYEWLVSGKNQLGILPSKIILAGDSAGGNFVLGVTFKVRTRILFINFLVVFFIMHKKFLRDLTKSHLYAIINAPYFRIILFIT